MLRDAPTVGNGRLMALLSMRAEICFREDLTDPFEKDTH